MDEAWERIEYEKLRGNPLPWSKSPASIRKRRKRRRRKTGTPYDRWNKLTGFHIAQWVDSALFFFSFLFSPPPLVKNVRFVGGKIHHEECSKTAPVNVDKTTNVTALQTLRLCCCSCYARQQQTYPRWFSFRGNSQNFVCARVSWAMKMKEADRRLYLITDAHDSYKNTKPSRVLLLPPLSLLRRQPQQQQQQQHGTVNCSRPMHHPSLAELPSDMMKSNRSTR